LPSLYYHSAININDLTGTIATYWAPCPENKKAAFPITFSLISIKYILN
jgi:hypothetical protein